MWISDKGEVETEEWHNYDDDEAIMYIEVSGSGSYEMKININNDAQDEEKEKNMIISGAIICIVAGIMIPFLVIGGAILAIVLVISHFKKKKQNP